MAPYDCATILLLYVLNSGMATLKNSGLEALFSAPEVFSLSRVLRPIAAHSAFATLAAAAAD